MIVDLIVFLNFPDNLTAKVFPPSNAQARTIGRVGGLNGWGRVTTEATHLKLNATSE